jgi:hydrogenase/urease accessory protein HupE
MGLAILMFVALCPVRLEAHLNSTGLGPVYDGALHLLSSPEDLVPAFAVALLGGLRGARHGRVAMFALPTAWFIGGLVGMAAEPASGTATAVASFVLLGTLIAADMPVPLTMLTALVIGLGLIHGYLNGAGLGPPSVGVQILLGLAGVLFVLVSVVGAFVVQLRQLWARTVVRVLGSWIVASGLLMLGWAVHSARAT